MSGVNRARPGIVRSGAKAGLSDSVAAALAALPVALAAIDPVGRKLFANAAFGALVGDPWSDDGQPDPIAEWATTRLARGVETDNETFPRGDRQVRVVFARFIDGCFSLTAEDVTRQAANEALARRDALTGLANRTVLLERLAEATAKGDAAPPTAVLLLDLDRFKMVNDTLGHPIGDKLLCRIAERLQTAVKDGDLVARLSGDEFAVVQPGGVQPDAAGVLAQRLVDLIGRSYVIDEHLVNVGVSVGVAVAPADGADADRVLKSADLALYRAKADGKGRFRFFEPEMDARAQERRSLELDLRKALALRELELHYQPQINLDSGRLVGFEALLRWRHPERGVVSPLTFVPLAEESGLIVPIGDWVLKTACREAASWPAEIRVAVNLSPVQFKAPNLVEGVANALAVAGLPADRLELEITEGVLMQDTEATTAVLHQLRAMGVHISMDDFGTGYSSLSYLRSFPFDKIKIDQAFVREMSVDPDCAAIVRAVAALGTSLGISTTAEGVETEEQFQRLSEEGCTDIQGYLISRPVPPAEIAGLIDRYLPSGTTRPASA